MYLKVRYCEVNKKVIYTLQTALTIHVNYEKRSQHIHINTSYCVSNAVEL
jgi:hypothetical protein